MAKATGASLVVVYCDSQVVVGQVNRDYEAKGGQMKKYHHLIKEQVGENFEARFM